MSTRERTYEEERLALRISEALAESMHRGKLGRSQLARKLGVSPAAITNALDSGNAMRLATIASIAWACGYRIVVTLEKLPTATGAVTEDK